MKGDDTVDTIDCGHGVTVDIVRDPDPYNPRDADNLGTMVCWHNRWRLGDGHSHENDDGLLDYLLGERGERIGTQRDKASNRWYDAHPKHTTEEYLQAEVEIAKTYRQMKWEALEKSGCVILPLFLYDHGGITMSTGDFGDRWDSGWVGWIYATRDDILKNWMCKSLTKKIKYPDGTVKTARERARDLLQAEVEEYDRYLTGECYGYVINTPDADGVESSFGFLGLDFVTDSARQAANRHVKQYADEARMCGANI